MATAPGSLATLVERFDADVFDARRRRTRIRLALDGARAWDVLVQDGAAAIVRANGRPDAVLTAHAST